MARSANTLAHLGRDLRLVPFFQAHTWQELDLVQRPAIKVYVDDTVDLEVAAGGDNLCQALILRLLTPQGSLGGLGHKDYGSRLHELIGRRNTPQNRLLARSFVLQALAQERRVAEVLALRVDDPGPEAPDTVRIHLQVRPVASPASPASPGNNDDSVNPITLGLEVAL